MGLGAPKKRSKLSHDPNNTAWSRSTDNFGHRMLAQQGWQPGQYLGAENANHSDHYTTANASHIRILLREDNLGLGAKIGGNKAETFGLSLFSGVLGRLNGKSDVQVQKQQDALRDAELRQYQTGRYGFMNFVSGGLLVGDRIQEPGKKGFEQKGQAEEAEAGDMVSEEEKGKKRKAEDADSGEDAARKKKGRSGKDGDGHLRDDTSERLVVSRRKSKKDRKAGADELSDDAAAEKKSQKRRKATADAATPPKISADEKAHSKQEKRARKEDRRRRKEEKRLRREAKQKSASAAPVEEAKAVVQSAPAVNGARHAVRQRYIQQKRMAGMDAKAMQEIFMIKAGA